MHGIVVIDDDGQADHPEPEGAEERQDGTLDDDDSAYNVSMEERHCIYGQRLALKDKGLVSLICRFIRRVSPVYRAAESS